MKSKIVKPKNLGNNQTSQLHSNNFASFLSASQQMDEARATLNYNKQQIQNEELFDIFMENSLILPLNEAFEPQIKQMFHSEKCVLWIDQPEKQILYSPTYSLTAGYSNSLPGFIYKTKNVIQVRDPSQSPGGFLSDPRIASPNSPQLFFPIETLGTVRGVVQIVKKQGSGGFSENDMQITSQIMRKFSIYGDSLFTSQSLSQIALSLYSGTTSNSNNGNKQEMNSLELLQKHFHCQKVELFHFDISRMIGQTYDAVRHEMLPINPENDNDFGLVGFSVSSQTNINSNDPKSESHYCSTFDSKIEGPLLIVSLMSGKRDAWSVALRGRQKMFSTADESQLSALLPFLVRSIAGFSSSEEQSAFNATLSELLDAAASMTMAASSAKIKKNTVTGLNCIASECVESDEIAKIIEAKAKSLLQCEKAIVYIVDNAKGEIVAVGDGCTGGMRRRFPKKDGLCGQILSCKKNVMNLNDPASDDHFSPEIDSVQGYTPKSLLGAPVLDRNGNQLALILLLTKKDEPAFDSNDEKILEAFAVFAGIALKNADVYRASVDVAQKIRGFFDLMRHTDQVDQLRAPLEEILKDAQMLLRSSRISLFIVNDSAGRPELERILNVGKSDSGYGATFSIRAFEQRKTLAFNQSDIKKGAPKSTANNDSSNKVQFQSISQIFEGDTSPLTKSSAPSKTKENERLVCVPLFNREMAALGVLEVHFTSHHKSEVDLIDSVAELAASFLDRADIRCLQSIRKCGMNASDWMSDDEVRSSEIASRLTIDDISDVRTVLTPDFDAVKFDGIGLFKVIFTIFSHFDLMKSFDITNGLLFTFLAELKRTYSTTSHHNFRHAVSAAQFIAYTVKTASQSDPKVTLSKSDILILITAALCHDSGHEPLSRGNPASLSALRILQSDSTRFSASMSCLASISLLSRSECDIFKKLDKSEGEKVDENGENMIELFVSLMLATDSMETDEIEELVQRGEFDVEGKIEHKKLLMMLMMRCSEFEWMARPFEIADRLLKEEVDDDAVLTQYKGEKVEGDGENDFGSCTASICFNACVKAFDVVAKVIPGFKKSFNQVNSNMESWKKENEKQ